ncbi:hypothetical protein GCM10010170_036280 [Dactylosporangium salmoneum]|uniref:Uncharacterized protein n=1 Tax=Dactylosporangium salmoneum TaxID=53361 RepID=A0ABP5T9M6_9ACTN
MTTTIRRDAPPSWASGVKSSRRVAVRPTGVIAGSLLAVAALAALVVAGWGIKELSIIWGATAIVALAGVVVLTLRGFPLFAILTVVAGAVAWGAATRGRLPDSWLDFLDVLGFIGINLAFVVPLAGSFLSALLLDARRVARMSVDDAVSGRRWWGEPDDHLPRLKELEAIPSARFFALGEGGCTHLVAAGRRVALFLPTVWPHGEFTMDAAGQVLRGGRLFVPGSEDVDGLAAEVHTWREQLAAVGGAVRGYLVVAPSRGDMSEDLVISVAPGEHLHLVHAHEMTEAAGRWLAAEPYRVDLHVMERLLMLAAGNKLPDPLSLPRTFPREAPAQSTGRTALPTDAAFAAAAGEEAPMLPATIGSAAGEAAVAPTGWRPGNGAMRARLGRRLAKGARADDSEPDADSIAALDHEDLAATPDEDRFASLASRADALGSRFDGDFGASVGEDRFSSSASRADALGSRFDGDFGASVGEDRFSSSTSRADALGGGFDREFGASAGEDRFSSSGSRADADAGRFDRDLGISAGGGHLPAAGTRAEAGSGPGDLGRDGVGPSRERPGGAAVPSDDRADTGNTWEARSTRELVGNWDTDSASQIAAWAAEGISTPPETPDPSSSAPSSAPSSSSSPSSSSAPSSSGSFSAAEPDREQGRRGESGDDRSEAGGWSWSTSVGVERSSQGEDGFRWSGAAGDDLPVTYEPVAWSSRPDPAEEAARERRRAWMEPEEPADASGRGTETWEPMSDRAERAAEPWSSASAWTPTPPPEPVAPAGEAPAREPESRRGGSFASEPVAEESRPEPVSESWRSSFAPEPAAGESRAVWEAEPRRSLFASEDDLGGSRPAVEAESWRSSSFASEAVGELGARERGAREPGTEQRGVGEFGARERVAGEPGAEQRGVGELGARERGERGAGARGSAERGAGERPSWGGSLFDGEAPELVAKPLELRRSWDSDPEARSVRRRERAQSGTGDNGGVTGAWPRVSGDRVPDSASGAVPSAASSPSAPPSAWPPPPSSGSEDSPSPGAASAAGASASAPPPAWSPSSQSPLDSWSSSSGSPSDSWSSSAPPSDSRSSSAPPSDSWSSSAPPSDSWSSSAPPSDSWSSSGSASDSWSGYSTSSQDSSSSSAASSGSWSGFSTSSSDSSPSSAPPLDSWSGSSDSSSSSAWRSDSSSSSAESSDSSSSSAWGSESRSSFGASSGSWSGSSTFSSGESGELSSGGASGRSWEGSSAAAGSSESWASAGTEGWASSAGAGAGETARGPVGRSEGRGAGEQGASPVPPAAEEAWWDAGKDAGKPSGNEPVEKPKRSRWGRGKSAGKGKAEEPDSAAEATSRWGRGKSEAKPEEPVRDDSAAEATSRWGRDKSEAKPEAPAGDDWATDATSRWGRGKSEAKAEEPARDDWATEATSRWDRASGRQAGREGAAETAGSEPRWERGAGRDLGREAEQGRDAAEVEAADRIPEQRKREPGPFDDLAPLELNLDEEPKERTRRFRRK